MSQIITIAAAATQTVQIQNIYEFLQFGRINQLFDCNVDLSYRGRQRINVTNASLLRAINGANQAGYSPANAADANKTRTAGNILQTAIGGKGNEQGTLTVTNNGADPVTIYGYSTSNNIGAVARYDQSTIVPNSNELYSDFEMLAVQTSASDFQVEFADGWSDRMGVFELIGLLSLVQKGLIAIDSPGRILVDNQAGIVKSIRVYSGGANVQVLTKTYETI